MSFAVLFPGQGSQKVGMGSDLFEKSNIAKDYFESVDQFLSRKLSHLFIHGPQEELNQTINTQIAIATVSIGLTLVLKEELKKKSIEFLPSATCGHSLGEFTSLWFINLLTDNELMNLVSIRGSLMQNAPPGGMAAALNLDAQTILKIIEENGYKDKIVIANYNSPGQLVISGNKDGITNLSEQIKLKGGKAIILPVGGAFHSPLMKEPSKKFNLEIEKVNLLSKRETTIPIFQNYDSKGSKDPKAIIEKLKNQMTSPVLWTQTITNLVNYGVNTVVEIGPGKVLTGLVKKINPNLNCYNISDLESLNDFVTNYEHKFLSFKS